MENKYSNGYLVIEYSSPEGSVEWDKQQIYTTINIFLTEEEAINYIKNKTSYIDYPDDEDIEITYMHDVIERDKLIDLINKNEYEINDEDEIFEYIKNDEERFEPKFYNDKNIKTNVFIPYTYTLYKKTGKKKFNEFIGSNYKIIPVKVNLPMTMTSKFLKYNDKITKPNVKKVIENSDLLREIGSYYKGGKTKTKRKIVKRKKTKRRY
jgi:hypothetical protein